MPRMSGLQLYENLLASGHAPPTIFMTAFATEALCAEVAAHAAHGALALLEKPIDALKLAHYLKQLATVQP
jgi:FixJ family two-component response regulator